VSVVPTGNLDVKIEVIGSDGFIEGIADSGGDGVAEALMFSPVLPMRHLISVTGFDGSTGNL